MFTRYFVELAVPHETVEAALGDRPATWLTDIATEAADHGRRLLMEVGTGQGPVRLDKRVRIDLGQPRRLASRVLVPLRWVATGPAALFPTMEGDLEIGALGPRATQLALSASYEPPLGRLGGLLDQALLHRLAEATVKDFLDRLGAAIERPALPVNAPGTPT
jgi:hypothetical protein